MSTNLREEIAKVFFYSEEAYDNTTWEEINRKTNYYRCADAVLTVLRNPSDEDVERAARAEYENAGTPFANWVEDTDAAERQEWRDDFRAALTAFLGGGEA